MFVRRIVSFLFALATLPACENNDYAPDQPEPRGPQPGQIVRQSSDGENISAHVVDHAKVIEVQEGDHCGVLDSNGALLSCEPGTYCLRSSEIAPGVCTRSPAAPRTE
jgi:hypothetical protein